MPEFNIVPNIKSQEADKPIRATDPIRILSITLYESGCRDHQENIWIQISILLTQQ